MNGMAEWERVELRVRIPDNVRKVRLACFSSENTGAVWFDDVEMVKV